MRRQADSPTGRRGFLLGASVFALGVPVATAVSQVRTLPLIAFQRRRDNVRGQRFLSELAARGYVEGRDFVVEFFGGDGAFPDEGYPRIVALAPAVIVTGGGPAAVRFAELTSQIPIITAGTPAVNAVALIGPDFSQPKGNVTGTVSASDTPGIKLLELARELVPGVEAVGLISNTGREAEFRDAARVAEQSLGVKIVFVIADVTDDLATIFAPLVRERVGIVVSPVSLFDRRVPDLMAYAKPLRMPVISSRIENVEAGGLVSYGLDQRYGYGRAADFVDRLFKGAKPSDMAAEQVSEFSLAINLAAARDWGFPIPPNVLARADVVIE